MQPENNPTRPSEILCSHCGVNVLAEGFGVSTANWTHRFYDGDGEGVVYHIDDDEMGDNIGLIDQEAFCRNCGRVIADPDAAATLIELADAAEYVD